MPEETPLPAEVPFAGEEDVSDREDADAGGEGALDRLRGTGVGVEDPAIVGDVGPTDIPPGTDPDGGLLADRTRDPDEPEG